MNRENERRPGENQGPGSPAERHDNTARNPIRPEDAPGGPRKGDPRPKAPKRALPPSPTEDRTVNPGLAGEDRQRLPGGDGDFSFGNGR